MLNTAWSRQTTDSEPESEAETDNRSLGGSSCSMLDNDYEHSLPSQEAWDFPLSRQEKVRRVLLLFGDEVERGEREVVQLRRENKALRSAAAKETSFIAKEAPLSPATSSTASRERLSRRLRQHSSQPSKRLSQPAPEPATVEQPALESAPTASRSSDGSGPFAYQAATDPASLMESVRNGSLSQVVRWLQEQGADPNRPDSSGNVPLIVAAETGNVNVIACLLIHNADPHQLSPYGLRAADLAPRGSPAEVVLQHFSGTEATADTTALGVAPSRTFEIALGAISDSKVRQALGRHLRNLEFRRVVRRLCNAQQGALGAADAEPLGVACLLPSSSIPRQSTVADAPQTPPAAHRQRGVDAEWQKSCSPAAKPQSSPTNLQATPSRSSRICAGCGCGNGYSTAFFHEEADDTQVRAATALQATLPRRWRRCGPCGRHFCSAACLGKSCPSHGREQGADGFTGFMAAPPFPTFGLCGAETAAAVPTNPSSCFAIGNRTRY